MSDRTDPGCHRHRGADNPALSRNARGRKVLFLTRAPAARPMISGRPIAPQCVWGRHIGRDCLRQPPCPRANLLTQLYQADGLQAGCARSSHRSTAAALPIGAHCFPGGQRRPRSRGIRTILERSEVMNARPIFVPARTQHKLGLSAQRIGRGATRNQYVGRECPQPLRGIGPRRIKRVRPRAHGNVERAPLMVGGAVPIFMCRWDRGKCR
jgi:hypothetical protein